eukprot:jgi/Botrbrau1/8584/Bobra.0380s0006.1
MVPLTPSLWFPVGGVLLPQPLPAYSLRASPPPPKPPSPPLPAPPPHLLHSPPPFLTPFSPQTSALCSPPPSQQFCLSGDYSQTAKTPVLTQRNEQIRYSYQSTQGQLRRHACL